MGDMEFSNIVHFINTTSWVQLCNDHEKVCVYPSKALWPTILPTIALNRALMNEDENNAVHGWRISRYSFFLVAFCASFVYNWVPSYLFKALSLFNWPTWFAPI